MHTIDKNIKCFDFKSMTEKEEKNVGRGGSRVGGDRA